MKKLYAMGKKTAKMFHKITFGIRYRIFFSVTLCFSMLIFLFSGVLIAYSNEAAREETKSTLRNLAGQITGSLDNYIDTMKDSLVGLVHDNMIPRIINREYSDDANRYRLYFTFYDSASSLLHFESFSGNQMYLMDPKAGFMLSSNSYFAIQPGSNAAWLEKLGESGTYFHYLLDFEEPKLFQDQFGFAVAVKVNDFSTYYISHDAYLIMVAGRSRFQYAIKQLDEMPFDALVILDQDDRLVYSQIESGMDGNFTEAVRGLEFSSEQSVLVDRVPYQAYCTTCENTGWRLVFFHSQAAIQDANKKMVRNTVLFDFVAIAVLLVVTYFLSRTVTQPVKRLMAGMDEMGRGNYGVAVTIRSNDEMRLLSDRFNRMSSEIDNLVNQVYREEMLRREAEIQTLQQQINPHFLYNTLESINALTNKGDQKGVKQITNRMARLFRYSMEREGNGLATIQEELRYTEDYISIQQIRYGSRLRYEIQTQEQLKQNHVLRFLLQPLVENCFSHGFRGAKTVMSMTLCCRNVPEGILFVIYDNGAGMSAQRLCYVRELLGKAARGDETDAAGRRKEPESDLADKRDTPVGMCNVHARVRLKYGVPFGVTVESEEGAGTAVRLLFPIL